MRRPRCIVGVLLALLAAGARLADARCTSTADCLQVIEAAQRDLRTITAEFSQVKHVSLLDEPLTSSGRFVFKRPDRILLQIEQPQAARIVIAGQEIRIPNLPEGERQALSMAPMAAMFTQLGAIFTGSTQAVRTGFDVTAHEDDDGIHLHLVPRQAEWQRMFRSIDVRFVRPELLAHTIRLEDGFGDNLEISLRNVQRNAEVPDATFDHGE